MRNGQTRVVKERDVTAVDLIFVVVYVKPCFSFCGSFRCLISRLLSRFFFFLSSLASSHLLFIPGVNRKDFFPFPITPKINFLHHISYSDTFSLCRSLILEPTQRVHRCITARRWTNVPNGDTPLERSLRPKFLSPTLFGRKKA